MTMVSTGLGSPQYHTHFMMKGFLKHHSQILSLRKASAVPSDYAREDPTHLQGPGGPETAGNTAEDATNHRGWQVTHQGQVTVQAEVGPAPLNSGAATDPLQNTTTPPPHGWLQAKRQTIPSIGRDVGRQEVSCSISENVKWCSH